MAETGLSMVENDDDDSSDGPGGHHEPITDDDVLAYVREQDGEPVGATEVADALDRSRRGVLRRLDDLAGDGRLEDKEIGARTRVFWFDRDAGGDADE